MQQFKNSYSDVVLGGCFFPSRQPPCYDLKEVKLEHNHIYPENDLIEHSTGIVDDDYSCPCNPEFVYGI